jgi:hypothetical protein
MRSREAKDASRPLGRLGAARGARAHGLRTRPRRRPRRACGETRHGAGSGRRGKGVCKGKPERLKQVAKDKERLPFDPAIAVELCEQIAEGGALKAVCATNESFPSPRRARQWLRANEGFAPQYAKACEELHPDPLRLRSRRTASGSIASARPCRFRLRRFPSSEDLRVQEGRAGLSTRHGWTRGDRQPVVDRAARVGGLPGLAPYAATKGAVEPFTRGLTTEVCSEGIRGECRRPEDDRN